VFTPFILAIATGTAVSWTNQDMLSHQLTTTPDHTAYLNPTSVSLTVPAGGKATHTFAIPGVYDFYDPSVATWNATNHRVAANRGAPTYPLAMEGVIEVVGTIAGAPAAATNPIPGKDEYQSEFLVVAAGGAVSWYNADTDETFVTLVSGWTDPINPTDRGAMALLLVFGSCEHQRPVASGGGQCRCVRVSHPHGRVSSGGLSLIPVSGNCL
jgi:plastocyanin